LGREGKQRNLRMLEAERTYPQTMRGMIDDELRPIVYVNSKNSQGPRLVTA